MPMIKKLPSALLTLEQTGIKLIKADDFETWWFTIEVMGESQYKVLFHLPYCTRPDHSLNVMTGRNIHSSISFRRTIPHILPSRPVCRDGWASSPSSPCTSHFFDHILLSYSCIHIHLRSQHVYSNGHVSSILRTVEQAVNRKPR